MIAVYGKSSSGKSEIAENIAMSIRKENQKMYYLATMEKTSSAAGDRIKRHRQLRDGKGFVTIEEEKNLKNHIDEIKGSVVLLEDLGNFVANCLYYSYGDKIIPDENIESFGLNIYNDINSLSDNCSLVIVTNDVFGNYYYQDKWCQAYMKIMGRINEMLAQKSQVFIESIMGRLNVLKGEVFWQ